MGFQTAIMIMNDAIHNLSTDPNVGQNIYNAMGECGHPRNVNGVSFAVGNHANAGMVLPPQHADVVQIVAIGGNYMRHIGYGHNMENSVALLKGLADSMGYRLVKKSK